MRIRWTPAAAGDLEQINDYLKERYPRHRQATLQKVYDTLRSLKDWPERGRFGLVEGTREVVFAPLPYVAVYRISGETIEILRIYHGAQDRP